MLTALILLLIGASAQNNKLIDGILFEVRKYPNTPTQCETDLVVATAAWVNLVEAFLEAQTIWDVFEYGSYFSNDVVHLTSSCQLRILYKRLAAVFTVNGGEELTARALYYRNDLLAAYAEGVVNLKARDYYALGGNIGVFLKDLFVYILV